MELNLDVVGQEITPRPFEYDWKTCALYALGIGSATDALQYTWEGVDEFRVLPSFAVIPTQPIVMKALARINADFRKLVHGAQTITLHRPVPAEGILQSTGRITEVQDKGKSAVIIVETETQDGDGNSLFDTSWSIVCRGQGGFGGERGENVVIPEVAEGSAPIFEKSYTTDSAQALLYRLSGDLNPLHVDPNLATKAGFPEPILHGLCTYGYATRQRSKPCATATPPVSSPSRLASVRWFIREINWM